LKSKNVENLDSFDVFKIDENSLKNKVKKKKNNTFLNRFLLSLKSTKNLPILRLQRLLKIIRKEMKKVRNGIFTHEILAKINTKNDVEKVLKSYLLEGLITETEKSEIAERIFEIIEKHPKYFTENQEVLSERELMIEGKPTDQTEW
jgi:hypothetical protein